MWIIEQQFTNTLLNAKIDEMERGDAVQQLDPALTARLKDDPDTVYWKTLKEEFGKDLDPMKWSKYIKYGAAALGGLVILKALKII